MARPVIPATETPRAVKVHCWGRRPDGSPCRYWIAELVDGRAVVRDHGRAHVVTATTCPKCGTARSFER